MKEKILVVDDEEDIRVLIGYNLKKAGYEVEFAVDGAEGIKKVKEFNPSIILLDIMMPEMDGIEACEKIRSASEFDNVFNLFFDSPWRGLLPNCWVRCRGRLLHHKTDYT